MRKARRISTLVNWKTVAAVTVLFCGPAGWMTSEAQNTQQAITKAADIDAIVDRAAKDYFKAAPSAVGVSIGVLKGGKTYTYDYGRRDKSSSARPESDSLYEIASITKTFTGTLLAQAATEKKLNLDDDVRKYMEGQYPNLEFQGHPIKVEQLVNHLSGLPFNLPDIPENRPPFPTPIPPAAQELMDHYSRKDFLADLHKVKLERIPGEKFSYSNAAAVLASIILERIYGKPYEEIVKEKIAEPLHMSDTTISLNESQRERLMKGYDDSGNVEAPVRDIMLGAASLKSTVEDLLKYAQWEMLEQDQAVKLSHEPTFTYNNYSAGLNWQMIRGEGYRRIWQEGTLPGFNSMCMVLPELKVGIVALANENDRASSHALTVMTTDITKALDPRSTPLF
jgi:CubicO group peptidase (beta-lactamase class C family)